MLKLKQFNEVWIKLSNKNLIEKETKKILLDVYIKNKNHSIKQYKSRTKIKCAIFFDKFELIDNAIEELERSEYFKKLNILRHCTLWGKFSNLSDFKKQIIIQYSWDYCDKFWNQFEMGNEFNDYKWGITITPQLNTL